MIRQSKEPLSKMYQEIMRRESRGREDSLLCPHSRANTCRSFLAQNQTVVISVPAGVEARS